VSFLSLGIMAMSASAGDGDVPKNRPVPIIRPTVNPITRATAKPTTTPQKTTRTPRTKLIIIVRPGDKVPVKRLQKK
jgi:hypothetical protein